MTPAPGSCLPLLFLCLPISAVRCCGAGSGVVSPACLPVSPSLCGQTPDAVTPAPGSCLPLVSLSPTLWLAAGSCLPLVSLCLCLPVSAVRCQTLAPGWGGPACLPLSPSLCSQMLDALVVCPAWLPVSQSLRSDACDAGSGFVSPPCLPVSQSVQSDVRCCDAGCGVVSCLPLVSLCPAKSLWSDPRRCDAGCGVVSCTCLPVSASLRGQMPDAVTLAPGRVSRLSPSFSQTLVPGLRSDARCWDAGSGVVSPACLPVSPSLCGWLFV